MGHEYAANLPRNGLASFVFALAKCSLLLSSPITPTQKHTATGATVVTYLSTATAYSTLISPSPALLRGVEVSGHTAFARMLLERQCEQPKPVVKASASQNLVGIAEQLTADLPRRVDK